MKNTMYIRPAVPEDLEAAAAIYEEMFDAEETAGVNMTRWKRGEYPTKTTAAEAIRDGILFVCEEDGELLASMRLNHEQPECYFTYDWQYPAAEDEILVIHTLCVRPSKEKRGVARAMAEFALDYGRSIGCKVLRFDTNAANTRAASMYAYWGIPVAAIRETLFEGCIPCHLNLYEMLL